MRILSPVSRGFPVSPGFPPVSPAALTSLENAYAHHETDANYIGVDPIFDPLRKEPRFQGLLKKLGL